MIAIRAEIDAVAVRTWTAESSPLRGAPRTVDALLGDWDRAYTREQAVFPAGRTADNTVTATWSVPARGGRGQAAPRGR